MAMVVTLLIVLLAVVVLVLLTTLLLFRREKRQNQQNENWIQDCVVFLKSYKYNYDTTDRKDAPPTCELSIPIETNPFTIGAWIRPSSDATTFPMMIMSKDRSCRGASQFRLQVWKDGRLEFVMADKSDMSIQTWPGFESAKGSVPLDQWSFVCVSRKGPQHTMYVDGKEISFRTNNVIHHTEIGDDSVMFRVGSRYPASGRELEFCFVGEMRSVFYIDQCRSSKEIDLIRLSYLNKTNPKSETEKIKRN